MKRKTVNLIFCALFTAIIAVCAQIQIPTPFFPITLQTFALALCGYTLGVKNSFFSVLAYIFLGVLGAPIFSGFCGGFHHITDPGGGFVMGFLPFSILCGVSNRFTENFKRILLGILGVLIMYSTGITYFCFLTGTNILGPMALVFIGLFIKDVTITVFAFYVAKLIRKRMFK